MTEPYRWYALTHTGTWLSKEDFPSPALLPMEEVKTIFLLPQVGRWPLMQMSFQPGDKLDYAMTREQSPGEMEARYVAVRLGRVQPSGSRIRQWALPNGELRSFAGTYEELLSCHPNL